MQTVWLANARRSGGVRCARGLGWVVARLSHVESRNQGVAGVPNLHAEILGRVWIGSTGNGAVGGTGGKNAPDVSTILCVQDRSAEVALPGMNRSWDSAWLPGPGWSVTAWQRPLQTVYEMKL